MPYALLAPASSVVVLAEAHPAAFLAPDSLAVVLADARPAALLAPDSFAVVLADARPATLLTLTSSAVVLADARPAALLRSLFRRLCSQMHCLPGFFYGCARRCSGFFTMSNESREWSPKLQSTDRLCETLDRLLKSHEGLVVCTGIRYDTVTLYLH